MYAHGADVCVHGADVRGCRVFNVIPVRLWCIHSNRTTFCWNLALLFSVRIFDYCTFITSVLYNQMCTSIKSLVLLFLFMLSTFILKAS